MFLLIYVTVNIKLLL